MSARDSQIGGSHYADMPVQPMDALEAWLTSEQFDGYQLGTAIVYLARYNAAGQGKGGLQDLRKARHVLDWMIERHEAVPSTGASVPDLGAA